MTLRIVTANEGTFKYEFFQTFGYFDERNFCKFLLLLKTLSPI